MFGCELEEEGGERDRFCFQALDGREAGERDATGGEYKRGIARLFWGKIIDDRIDRAFDPVIVFDADGVVRCGVKKRCELREIEPWCDSGNGNDVCDLIGLGECEAECCKICTQPCERCSEIVFCMRSPGDNGPGSENRELGGMMRDRDATQLQ